MGWLFTQLSRASLIRELTQSNDCEEASNETIRHADCDSVLWSVVKLTAHRDGIAGLKAGESTLFIRCDLLEGSSSGWGYKPLEEAMHPYYFSCPMEFLDMVPVQCPAWREQVREHYRLVHQYSVK